MFSLVTVCHLTEVIFEQLEHCKIRGRKSTAVLTDIGMGENFGSIVDLRGFEYPEHNRRIAEHLLQKVYL